MPWQHGSLWGLPFGQGLMLAASQAILSTFYLHKAHFWDFPLAQSSTADFEQPRLILSTLYLV